MFEVLTMEEDYKKLRIVDIKEETPHAKTFTLKAEDDIPVVYKAGQFISLVFQEHAGEQRRSYSFSSSPVADKEISITIKYVENGAYSRMLLNKTQVGDMLCATGVSGFFVLPESEENFTELFFFAAGSGITPIFSLIKTALHQHKNWKIRLVYSSRNQEETIFYNQLSQLQTTFENRFSILFLFSASKSIMNARLNNFMVSGMVEKIAGEDLSKIMFYICGPLEYMDNIFITLLTEGVPRSHIRKENFATEKPEILEEPTDKDSHLVTIKYNNDQHTFATQYPVTILQQALKLGLRLPYSCEAGQCGSCTARCVKGKVWMYYNEVLTDKELEEGLVLTCTGFPVGDDVELRYE